MLLFSFITISSIGYSQGLFTYKIQVSSPENPKIILATITESMDFTSRRIEEEGFIINSPESYDESYFESIVQSMGKELLSFQKTTNGLIKDPINYQTKACCDITIEMFDSWGDGWNGAQLTVTIDGTSSTYSATGSGSVASLAYCDGQNLQLSYSSGSYDNEVTYDVYIGSTLFFSDGTNPSTGIVYTSSSLTCPTPTGQDCEGSQIVCSNASFSGNSSGAGNYSDLSSSNDGCLFGENQSSWYYVNIGTSGTLSMDIVPSNGTDDYDFAIWGPFNSSTANANCPPVTSPIRCNYVQYPRTCGFFSCCGTNTNPTGMAINPSLPTSNNDCTNNSHVRHLNVTAGEIYIMVIDNYSGSSQPFNLNWGGSAGLDCTPVNLPVELLSFDVQYINKYNELSWITASEINNDYFILEHSSNGQEWSEIEKIKGAGNSNIENTYSTTHRDFVNGINYYRLKQVDFDGKINEHKLISIDNSKDRMLLKRVNSIGQEVDENYKGVVFEYYSDGTTRKIMQ